MSVSKEYLAFISELFHPLGSVSVKRMFSGAGFYCDEIFFALIIDDVLYLKTDDENRPFFEALKLEPFSYDSAGKHVVTSYRRAPDDALDSPDAMRPWARGAIAAALRSPDKAKRKRKSLASKP